MSDQFEIKTNNPFNLGEFDDGLDEELMGDDEDRRKLEMMKSSIEITKDSNAPDTIPGTSSGSVIRHSMGPAVAPRSAPASKTSLVRPPASTTAAHSRPSRPHGKDSDMVQ